MSTGLELSAIDEFVYATLTSDVALMAMTGNPAEKEVHVDTIPLPEYYPYIFAQMLSTADTLTSDGYTVLTRADYNIKAVDRAESYMALKPMAARMYQLLHQAQGVVGDGQVLKCIRMR